MLENLLINQNWLFENILPKGRKDNFFSISFSVFGRKISFFKIAKKISPDLILSISADITNIGSILNIPSVIVGEDDWDVIPIFARITYTFADNILVPEVCRMGAWKKKAIFYNRII